jgi:hypothetical protein
MLGSISLMLFLENTPKKYKQADCKRIRFSCGPYYTSDSGFETRFLGDSRGPVCMAGLFVAVAVWWGAAVLAFWGKIWNADPLMDAGLGSETHLLDFVDVSWSLIAGPSKGLHNQVVRIMVPYCIVLNDRRQHGSQQRGFSSLKDLIW